LHVHYAIYDEVSKNDKVHSSFIKAVIKMDKLKINRQKNGKMDRKIDRKLDR